LYRDIFVRTGKETPDCLASNEYAELPGALTDFYGVFLHDNRLLSLSRYEYAKVAAPVKAFGMPGNVELV
jgi:hypothetical protein